MLGSPRAAAQHWRPEGKCGSTKKLSLGVDTRNQGKVYAPKPFETELSLMMLTQARRHVKVKASDVNPPASFISEKEMTPASG